MKPQDLFSAFLVRKVDLDLNLEPSWAQDRLVDEVLPVGDANDQDVVQGLHTINACQELIDNKIVDSVACLRASLLANGVDFVKDDAVEVTVRPLFLLFPYGIFEQVSDVLLTSSYKLTKNLWAVDYLGLELEDLADFSCDQSLARSWRAIKEHAFDVFDSELFHHPWVEHPHAEDSPFNELKLFSYSSHFEVLRLRLIVLEKRLHLGIILNDVYLLLRLFSELNICLLSNDSVVCAIIDLRPYFKAYLFESQNKAIVVVDDQVFFPHLIFQFRSDDLHFLLRAGLKGKVYCKISYRSDRCHFDWLESHS